MYELESARGPVRDWVRRQATGPADPESMEDAELADWWADEALHGAELVRKLLDVLDQQAQEATAPTLRTLEPGQEDEDLVCPDCGQQLMVEAEEVDYRRGATWLADGSILVGKSDSVETIEIRIGCPRGHGQFEVPDVADWA